MPNWYVDVIRKDPRFRLPNLNRNLALLEPHFGARVRRVKEFAESQGHGFHVVETYRAPARQSHLFKDGVAGSKTVGARGYGLQVDFQLLINGVFDPASYDHRRFIAQAESAGVLIGLKWSGGKGFDSLLGVPAFREADLVAGVWFPGSGYDVRADERAHGVGGL